MSRPGYSQTLEFLAQLSPLGIQPGLSRIADVLRRLDFPEQRYPSVHIAGTNGKGSTSAYAASIANVAARRAAEHLGRPLAIGLYTSPHLHRLTERICFGANGQLNECPKQTFADAVAQVRAVAETEPTVPLTFFEFVTAAAFLLFAQQKVDLAIIETGLGGRLDATKLCAAQVTVVTSIGLDHMDWLGPSLAHIAYEKAGIFRPGVPTLCATYPEEARQVLRRVAKETAAPLFMHPYHGEPDAAPLPLLSDELRAVLPLPGAHQADNASLAVAALSHVDGPLRPFLHDPDVIREGLAKTRWPGRLERIVPTAKAYQPFANREIIVDAAHNPEGAQVLSAWLEKEPPASLTVICGVVVGKLATEMAAPLAHASRIILCRPPTPRGLPAAELAQVPGFSRGEIEDDWHAALDLALAKLPQNGRMLVYGSIFLIAAVRAALLDEPTDELLVQDPGRRATPPV